MQELKFPTSSSPGRIVGEGDGRLLNAYATKQGDQVYIRRSPGLTAVQDFSFPNPRGIIATGLGGFLVAYTGAVMNDGVAMSGSIPGTDTVFWAENNNGNIVGVRTSGGAYTLIGTSIAAYSATDADLPANVNSATYGKGYFFFSQPNGTIWASGINTFAIDPLSFATAESARDDLLRVIWHGGLLYAFGTQTIEPWVNAETEPFPLILGTSVIPCGLLSASAVAGSQSGWDRQILFVASDGTVRSLSGYRAEIVSTPPVEKFIRQSGVASMVAFVYTFGGNAMWVLNTDQGTWEYNVTTGLWNERDSEFNTGWRARHSGKHHTGRWYFGDILSSNVIRLSEDLFQEVGQTHTFLVESAPFMGFPAGVVIPALFVDFTDAAATASISWSKDGGATWSTPVTRSMADAQKWPVRVNRLGLSSQHGLRVRITVSDNVDFSLMGATIAGPEVRQGKPDARAA